MPVVPMDTISSGVLCGIQSVIRTLNQTIRNLRTSHLGHTQADRDLLLTLFQWHWMGGNRLSNTFGSDRGLVQFRSGADDREFVAPKAAENVHLAQN